MTTGRPTIRTPEIDEAILAGLAAGRFLRDVCADDGMPNEDSVYRWMDADPEFRGAYARARARGATPLVADGMKILDDCDGTTASQVMKARERAAYRRWLATCYDRATFGEKQGVELSGPNGGPIPQDVRHDVSPQFAAEVGAILAGIGVTIVAGPEGAGPGPSAAPEPVGAPPPAPEAGGAPRS